MKLKTIFWDATYGQHTEIEDFLYPYVPEGFMIMYSGQKFVVSEIWDSMEGDRITRTVEIHIA